MSTKNVTTNNQQTQFNQPSMSTYNAMQPMIGSALTSNINNPYSNMFFNTQLAMGNQALGQQQSSANQALLQRAQALGMSANSPLMMSQMGQMQRQGMANQAGLYNNLLLQAGQMRMQSLGMAQNYRPLQIGSNSTTTQQQSGLGTWLPQVAGMGLSLATGGLTGGFGGMFGGGGGNPFGGAGSGPLNPLMYNSNSYGTGNIAPNFGSGVNTNFGNPNSPNALLGQY